MENYQDDGFLKGNAIWLIVLIALVVFGFLLFKGWDQVLNRGIDSMSTITGNFSCLPYKPDASTDGEECVLGVRSQDGSYYALDISRIQDANTDLKAEDTIAVTGTLKPDEAMLEPEWEDYLISGVIHVNTLLRTR